MTSLIYARVRADLKKRGITLPDPDYWIAAYALQNQAFDIGKRRSPACAA